MTRSHVLTSAIISTAMIAPIISHQLHDRGSGDVSENKGGGGLTRPRLEHTLTDQGSDNVRHCPPVSTLSKQGFDSEVPARADLHGCKLLTQQDAKHATFGGP